MQANGQRPRHATGLGGSCREEAAARRPRHGRRKKQRAMQANGRRGILSILGVWRLANGRLERPNNRGYAQATAGCNAGTAGAYGHRAGWKPMQANGRRGILSILGIWRLANGRLERANNRGYVQATASWSSCNAGTAGAYGLRAGWKLPRGSGREAP